MKLDFINGELRESRLFRSDSLLRQKSTEDIKNTTFLYMITLAIMSYDINSARFVQDYLAKTFRNGFQIRKPKHSDTDLYWLLYILDSKDYKILDPSMQSENEVQMLRIVFDRPRLTYWFKNLISGRATQIETDRVLYKTEQDFKISETDYRALRIAVDRWDSMNSASRSLTATRLRYALNRYARMSDIFPDFDRYIKQKDYLVKDLADPELFHGHVDIPENPFKTMMKSLNLMAPVGLFAVSFIAANKTKEMMRDRYSRQLRENAAAGATSAGGIASTVLPIGAVIKRSNRKEKSPK